MKAFVQRYYKIQFHKGYLKGYQETNLHIKVLSLGQLRTIGSSRIRHFQLNFWDVRIWHSFQGIYVHPWGTASMRCLPCISIQAQEYNASKNCVHRMLIMFSGHSAVLHQLPSSSKSLFFSLHTTASLFSPPPRTL